MDCSVGGASTMLETKESKILRTKGLNLMYKQRDCDGAIQQFQKALGQNNELSSKLCAGDLDYTVSSRTKLNDLVGHALFQKGDYKGALKQFRIALLARNVPLQEEDNEASSADGGCSSGCGNGENDDTTSSTIDSSMSSASSSSTCCMGPDMLALDSDLAWIYYRMAKCYYHTNKFDFAIEYYEKAKAQFYVSNPLGKETTMLYKIRQDLKMAKRKRQRQIVETNSKMFALKENETPSSSSSQDAASISVSSSKTSLSKPSTLFGMKFNRRIGNLRTLSTSSMSLSLTTMRSNSINSFSSIPSRRASNSSTNSGVMNTGNVMKDTNLPDGETAEQNLSTETTTELPETIIFSDKLKKKKKTVSIAPTPSIEPVIRAVKCTVMLKGEFSEPSPKDIKCEFDLKQRIF